MYTQIVLLLFVLRSISAYTLVQVQDQKSTRNQERPTGASGSLRPFTNSHAGYQFTNRELDSLEHREPREDDKVIDKIITNSDSSNDDADYHTDEHDEIDKLDEIRQSQEPKNQMFDEIKEKYKKHYTHRFIKRIESETIDKDRRRRQSNYYQPFVSSPVLRDEYGNILHDNVNAVFSGGHLANVPRAYGMNQRNDHGYSYNHINNMQNEPIYNPYTQTIQQRPVEVQTVNNYAYKTVQQSPQEVEALNAMHNYKQPTNEAMYNQLISQPLQQKQVETQTLNAYKSVQQSLQEIALTNSKPMYSQPTNIEAMYNQVISQPLQQKQVETQTLYTYKPEQQSLQEIALTNSKPVYSQPTNNEAMYNQLISQQVQQKAVDTQTSYKPIQQLPQEVELSNGQPIYNQHISQSVQQKPIEAKTVNNNAYKTEQQLPQEPKLLTNKSMLPIPEKTETDNKNKLHQAPHEMPKKNTANKNITQIFETETTRNNVDVNRNVRNHEDMKNNVNQMSKKIGSIKEKVKDRIATANLSGILTSPGGRKLLQSYGIVPTGKEDNKNISARIFEVTQPDPDHVIIDEKLEDIIRTIATKDISNNNDTVTEVVKGTEQIENPVNISVFLNTENQNSNYSALNQADVENVPEPLSAEILNTTKISTAPEEIKSTEEYLEPRISAETFNYDTAIIQTQEQTYTDFTRENQIESAGTNVTANDGNEKNCENKADVKNVPEPLSAEMLNTTKISTAPEAIKSTEEYLEPRISAETFNYDTAIVQTQEQTYTDLIRENQIESAGTNVTANDGNEKNSENKEKYDPEDADVKKSEILNLDKLFDRDEFWEWLSNWTTTYMEIVNEKIAALVKDEVAKQMEDLYLVTKTELIESFKHREHNIDEVEIGNEQERKMTQSTET